MGIKADFTKNDVLKHVNNRVALFEQLAIRRLTYIGETAVNKARSAGNYKDQTGNLRSSIGYVVTKNGMPVSFARTSPVAGPEGTGEEGNAVATRYCEELAKRIPRGIALILVAGMDYAAAVYDKGYDVLTSGKLIAEVEVPKMLKKLGIGQ